jgi:hypothetical protein
VEGARNAAALEALKEQGFEIGESVMRQDGRVQHAIRSKNESAWVETGQELWNLAAGRLTLANINDRRRADLSKTATAARSGKKGKEP